MILDVSVTVKWLLDEPWTDRARALLPLPGLVAPDLIDLEIGSVLTRKSRQGVITDDEARDARSSHALMPVRRVDWRSFEPDAFDLSLSLQAHFYDCVYLALAIEYRDILVTADEKFVWACRRNRALDQTVVELSQT